MKTETSEHFAEGLCTNTLTALWKKEQGKGGAHQWLKITTLLYFGRVALVPKEDR